MKKKIVIASILGLVMMLAMSVPAMATHDPQDSKPDAWKHHHHSITLPNGDCLNIPAYHTAFNNAEKQNGNARVSFYHGEDCVDD